VAEAATSTVEGHGATVAQPAVATAHALEHFSGRAISWVGVSITCLGFLIGAFAFIPIGVASSGSYPLWWLFWVSAGIAALGSIVLIGAKTFSQDWY